MRRGIFFILLAALLAWAALSSRYGPFKQQEVVFEPANKPPQLAPLCPWRNPEADLPKLFPGASRFYVESRILSGLRPELAQRLGRMPTADENTLQVYRIYGPDRMQGEVVTRRVKGSYGAIEVVIAADENRRFKGLLIQRMREPQAASQALLGADWARWLGGKTAESCWECEGLQASLPSEARVSADAVLAGVRSSIILLATSAQTPNSELTQSHRH